MPSNQNNNGCVIFSGFFAAGFGISLMAFGISAIGNFQSEKSTCLVTNITYPTYIPMDVNEIDSNFSPCDCGRRCMSDLGYCIKIYVTYENVTYMAYNSVNMRPETSDCTISETRCNNGEQLSDRIEALSTAKAKAEPYEQAINTTSPIDCYVYGGNVFLVNDLDNTIVIMSVLGSITLVFTLCAVISCRNSENNN